MSLEERLAQKKKEEAKKHVRFPKSVKEIKDYDPLDIATNLIIVVIAALIVWVVFALLGLLVSKTVFLKGLFAVLQFIGKWTFIVTLIVWIVVEVAGFIRRVRNMSS